MGYIARICYCNRLKKDYGNHYETQKAVFIEQLRENFNYVRNYNSKLNENIEKSYNRLLDKIFGRCLTIILYLILDMSIETIHNLLRTGEIDYKIPKHDAAYRFITRSFFIDLIPHDCLKDYTNPAHRNLKQRIFNNLSDFEKEQINNFLQNALDEIKNANWFESEEHKVWLNEHVVNRMWKPT